MERCKSYHTQIKRQYIYDVYFGLCVGCKDETIGTCWGTKECEQCFCQGDRTKCDFYPEIREKAYDEIKNNNKIIKCKDCKVPHNKYTGCPKLNGLVTFPDFYCAFAEE